MSRILRLFALLAVGSLAALAITAALLLAGGPSGPASAQAIGGPVFVSGDDAEDHCDGTNCGGLMVAVLNSAIDLSLSPGTGIAAIGMEDPDNTDALNSWNDPGNGGPGVPITVIHLAQIPTVDFADFAVIFVPSNETDGSDPVGIDDSELVALNARKADIVDFVNNLGGGLIAITEQDADPALAFGFLPLPLEFANIDYQEAEPTPALAALAPNATTANMAHSDWHNVWTGPPGFSGLDILATAVITESELDGLPTLLGGARVILRGLITLTPETATNTVGEDHTVTANVSDGVEPVEGVEVTFTVTGQNDDTGTATTVDNGDATFTYTGDGGAGTDTIQACFLDEEEQQQCVTATKEWVEPTPTPTPTPTAVAEVVQLPTTGGMPSDGGSGALPWLAALAGALALMGASSGLWLARQRRRIR